MEKRIDYFDYLRVLAIYAVITIHVLSKNWYDLNVNTFEWQIFNIYDSICRWSVPVFIMISGALLLGKEHNIKKIFKKNIFHLTIAFIFWGIIYAIINYQNKEQFIIKVISGHYHMWFIQMIVGLYICTPILKKIVESEKITKYFLVLSFCFNFLFPQIILLVNDFGGETLIKIFNTIDLLLNKINLQIVLGYTGYFIGGYYLNKIDINKKYRKILYILGILGALITILLSAYISFVKQQPIENYYGNFCINILIQAIAVFVWFKYNAFRFKKIYNIIKKISECSFGIYLVHVLIIDYLIKILKLNILSFNPLLSIPTISFIVFIISFILSAILKKIPLLKKYIV